jgi:MFS superfamily sulfate permease-like transporter
MNKELRAQGIGNMISGLIGGLPITQVIVRSSANIQAGGKSRVSAIFHGVLILFAVLAFPFLLNTIPLSALAAILLVVGYKLAKPSLFKKMYQYGWSQFIPFMVTIVAILFTDLLIGIGIGMGVGILFVLHRNFKIPYSYKVTDHDDVKEITITLSEIASFLNKGNIISTLRIIPDGSHVIIDASRSVYIDPDVIDALEDFKENAEHRGVTFEMRNVNETVMQSMPSPAKSLIKELEAAKTATDAKNEKKRN